MTASISTFESQHNGLNINTNADKGQGCYTKILDKHQAHLQDMVNKHSQVMQVRFDLRFPRQDEPLFLSGKLYC